MPVSRCFSRRTKVENPRPVADGLRAVGDGLPKTETQILVLWGFISIPIGPSSFNSGVTLHLEFENKVWSHYSGIFHHHFISIPYSTLSTTRILTRIKTLVHHHHNHSFTFNPFITTNHSKP